MLCDALLFALFGSEVEVAAVNVAVPVVPPASALYCELITTNWPGLSVPRAHGYGVVQAPLFETNEIDEEFVAESVTPVAADGPLFCTLTVRTKFEPVEPVDGPLTLTAT